MAEPQPSPELNEYLRLSPAASEQQREVLAGIGQLAMTGISEEDALKGFSLAERIPGFAQQVVDYVDAVPAGRQAINVWTRVQSARANDVVRDAGALSDLLAADSSYLTDVQNKNKAGIARRRIAKVLSILHIHSQQNTAA